MSLKLQTPKHKVSLLILAAALYLTAPLVEWHYYSTELARGSYPPDADTIAIPIFQFFVGWTLGAPVAALLLWFGLRSYPGAISFFAFNKARPLWSAIWTLVFGYLLYEYFVFAVTSIQNSHPFDAAQSFLIVYLQICLRSSIIYSTLFKRRFN